jgi:hypothetical protein
MSALALAGDGNAARRRLPVATVGGVNVLAPAGTSPYFRLTWTQPDGTAGRTSGGRTLAGATAKATEIAAALHRAAGGKAMTPLREIVADYLSSPLGRNQKTGGDWEGGQLTQTRTKLNKSLRGHEDRLAMEVDRQLLDKMRSEAGTRRTRKENATALRGLLRWGATQRYFTAEQAELLPPNVIDIVGDVMGTEAPRRRDRARRVGDSEEYIGVEDAPDRAQIVELGARFQNEFPLWVAAGRRTGRGRGPALGRAVPAHRARRRRQATPVQEGQAAKAKDPPPHRLADRSGRQGRHRPAQVAEGQQAPQGRRERDQHHRLRAAHRAPRAP